jgi:hypothetical protein
VRLPARLIALIIAGVLVLLACAGAVSVAIGEPSSEVHLERDVSARRAAVWRRLADLGSYGDWNPLFVEAEGGLGVGETLRLKVAQRDGGTHSRKVKIFALVPLEKLRWQDRMLVPGLRDREFTIRLETRARTVTHVSVTERLEGPLVPLTDGATPRAQLAGMVAALGRAAAPDS